MKMRKGSGEIGCLLVIVIVGLIITGSCSSNWDHECEMKKLELEAARERDHNTLRIRVLEEEVRQLKALVPSNVTINVDLGKIIRKETK